MESYALDICGREKGSLLQNKTFVHLEGPVLSIRNTFQDKTVSFVHAAWNHIGNEIIAGDNLGNIYKFCLPKNKFALVCRLKFCSSFVCFTKKRAQDVLVALSDCSIVSLNSETGVVINIFNHHTSCVMHISLDKAGEMVLSCCKDQAILWDLNSFTVIRNLTLKKDVDIVKVFFLSNDTIVSSFNDNSVFLWNATTFNCVDQFICTSDGSPLNLKAIDGSGDGKLVACGGKSNSIIIYSIPEKKKLHTIVLPENITFVKQVNFFQNTNNKNILSALSWEGEVFIFNVGSAELLYKMTCKNGKIVSVVQPSCTFQLLVLSLQGHIELYDLEERINDKHVKYQKHVKSVMPDEKKYLHKKQTQVKKKEVASVDKAQLRSVVKNFEEYPEKHRFYIWSQLLELPHNSDAFNVFHQDSLKVKHFVKDYSFMNPGLQSTFLRMMSMLVCWHPIIQELEYFQCVAFPFIKVLHKNKVMCFELLVTLISNWCRNWFLFCPFRPFNILCAVENLIAYHDKELMVHFIKFNVPAEVYAWSLLKSSFSEVFNKKQWLKLWDNIFSNPPSFQLHAVAAFSIVMRNVLLRCTTLDHFKDCYRKHGISASVLVKKTYALQESAPEDIDPRIVIGDFCALPQGTYPSFFQMSQMKIDFETLRRKTILDQEIEYLKQREDHLEVKSNYLKELQEYQILRRKLLLETAELEDADGLESLEKKLKAVQKLIQGNLTDQVAMLKTTLGQNMFSEDKTDTKKYFQFQDYLKRTKRKS